MLIALLEEGVEGAECIELDRAREKNLVGGEAIRGSDESKSVARAGNVVSRPRGEVAAEGTKAGMRTVVAETPGELSCTGGKDELRIDV